MLGFWGFGVQEVIIDLMEFSILLEMAGTENIPTKNEDFSLSKVRNTVPVLTTLQMEVTDYFDFH